MSTRQAIIDSLGATHGGAAQKALESDAQALKALPERSQSSLSVWRFPDESLVLCCRCADDSFAKSAAALSQSKAFLLAVGEPKASSFARANRGGWGAQGAYPLNKASLLALLSGMADVDGQWKRGIRLSDNQGKDLSFNELQTLALSTPNTRSSLDEALAAVLAEKQPKRMLGGQ